MTGVLYDKTVALMMKGKFYNTITRPAMIWISVRQLIRIEELKRKVAEMIMLRWMYSATRLNKIRNLYIRSLGIANITG